MHVSARIVLVVCVLGLTACGDGGSPFASGDYTAYSSLTDAERLWVVPETAGWADGKYCWGGECDWPPRLSAIDSDTWVPIAGVSSTDVQTDHVRVVAELSDVSSRATADQLSVNFRLETQEEVDQLREAFDRDLDVWVKEERPASVLVFDDRGRVAAIGVGNAQRHSELLIRERAERGAESPYALFLEFATAPAPRRLLMVDNPGLVTEVISDRRIRADDSCVQYGRARRTLVFPTGTVGESTDPKSRIEVLDNWSGLEHLPTDRTSRDLILTVQSTTLEALGVPAFSGCNNDAYFVEKIEAQ